MTGLKRIIAHPLTDRPARKAGYAAVLKQDDFILEIAVDDLVDVRKRVGGVPAADDVLLLGKNDKVLKRIDIQVEQIDVTGKIAILQPVILLRDPYRAQKLLSLLVLPPPAG